MRLRRTALLQRAETQSTLANIYSETFLYSCMEWPRHCKLSFVTDEGCPMLETTRAISSLANHIVHGTLQYVILSEVPTKLRSTSCHGSKEGSVDRVLNYTFNVYRLLGISYGVECVVIAAGAVSKQTTSTRVGDYRKGCRERGLTRHNRKDTTEMSTNMELYGEDVTTLLLSETPLVLWRGEIFTLTFLSRLLGVD
jgi:hypothetical protein